MCKKHAQSGENYQGYESLPAIENIQLVNFELSHIDTDY